VSFLETIERARAFLERQQRVSLRALRREFGLDTEALDELVEELVDVQRVARREENVLVWLAQSTPDPAVPTLGTVRPTDRAEARKVVTIIFADLIGSTSLHERLDPESVTRLMERYYRAMRGAVEAHGGTVVKLMGDGVMAAFGVPRVAEDDAIRAVRAGVAMQDAFRELARKEFAARLRAVASGGEPVGAIGLRVGINTGEVVVSADNTDVVGDPVNVAARLQTEAHDGEVVIGESTRRLVAALVTLAPLGSFALKGRTEAMKAYRVESLDRPVAATTAAFVGRDDELARISAVYEAALATPAARLAVLLGSPGLGKSRLIEEFTRRLGPSTEGFGPQAGDTASVIAAQCDAEGGATFAPVAEALREFLLQAAAQASPAPAQGDALGLDLAAPSGLSAQPSAEDQQPQRGGKPTARGNAPGGGGDAHDLRAALKAAVPATDADRDRIIDGITALLAGSPASPEETFFIIRRFLAALAATRPIVLVIDDLQWAAPLLLDLIEHLVQWGSGVPLLVLVGARPELRDVRSSLATSGGCVSDVVTLGGLDAGAAMRLAANVIGAADLPAAVAAKVLATSEGNPLFVAELVRMLVQEGVLKQEGERWTSGAGLAELEMPPTIHALLAARIERLGPEERSVLERAAVIGRHFSRSAVAALLPRALADLDVRLEALRRAELIQPDGGWLLGEPVLRFHHILIRDAAYRRLLKGTRAELHEQLADWIEAQVKDAPEHDEIIGWHLEQAHQHRRELGPLDAQGKTLGERAAQRLAAAGRRALARDDLPVAANLLGRAVDRLDVDDAARADLALDWCEALLAAGEVGPAAAAIEELGRFALREGEAPAEPGAATREGEAPAEPGVAGGGESVPTRDQARREPCPPTEGERIRAWHTCFASQLTVLTAPQKLQSAADAVAAAAQQLSAQGDAAGEAKAHSVHAQALARLGKVGACEAALDQALAAARRAGDRRRANAVLAGAPLAALWGPSPVTRASGRCLDVVRVLRITQGAPAVESVALSCQGVLEALRGRTEAARRMLASSRKMVEDLGIAHRLLEADAFSGRIAAMEGDAAGAERLLRSAYEGLRELGLGIDAARAGALLARTLLAQDRVTEAESLSHESERLAGDDLQAAIAWRGVRAEALAKRGEHAEAVELAQAAVAIASATDALLDHADARMALAAALRAAGRGAAADAEERRAIELWEAKGATLLAERVRSDRERAAPTIPAAAPIATPTAVRRRVRPNAATAMQTRFDAALAARDFDAITTQFREDHQEIDHPTGSTYGRDACVASLKRLFRSRDPKYEVEPLATVGELLLLVRRRSSASGAASGRYDVGAYENEAIQLFEVDESGLCCRSEVFAADHLGAAVARLYERYAELLPDCPERERAAATARSFGVMLTSPGDIDRVATVIAPDFESVDHRHLSTWSMRGGGAFLAHNRALQEVAADVVIGTHDVLALGPGALLIQRMHSGTARLGGGAYERPFLVLFATDADGRLARAEWFDSEGEAQALARFEVLVAGTEPKPLIRRSVRANAATRHLERQWTAIEARDVDALTALSAGAEVIHHPTGATYGATEVIALHRGLWRGTNLKMKQEVLATLGDSLALMRRTASHDGVDAKLGSVGPVEVEFVGVFEVDERTQAKRSEIFAGDRLGEAITRLYARYAELLPRGAERECAAATARTMGSVLRSVTLDRWCDSVADDFELVDHRVLGIGSLRGGEAMRANFRAMYELEDIFEVSIDDVTALRSNAILVRGGNSGVIRSSGGAYERRFLQLWSMGSDGRFDRFEYFDADKEAEALARFDELLAEPTTRVVHRRVRPNAGSAAMARIEAALAAGDLDAFAVEIRPDFEEISHPTGATYGREAMLRSVERFLRLPGAKVRHELLATLGDRLWLLRRWMGASAAGRTNFDVGEYEKEEVGVHEVDEHGMALRNETFAADRLGDALVRLYERFAELPPEGAQRARAAGIARSLGAWNGRVDLDRFRAAFDPSYQNIDHRFFGTWSTGDAAETLRHYRLQLDLAPDFAGRYDEVFAANARALVARMTFFGTARDSGGRFENQLCALIRFGADGRMTHTEVFEAEQVVEALARFVELIGRGTDSVADWFENAAARADRELFDCFNARDWAGVEALAAPELVFDERRRMLHNTCGREVWLEQFRVLFDVPASHFTTRLLATRGERLSLSLHLFAGEVAGGGGPLAMDDHLVLHEVDRDGRIVAIVLFDLEDRNAAYDELDARWAADEAAAHPLASKWLTDYLRFFAARDWNAMTTLFAPELVGENHRLVGWGTLHGPAAVVSTMQAQIELAPDTQERVDHVRTCEDAVLFEYAWHGTHAGGAFENLWIVLVELDADGRGRRADVWEAEQLEQARARFDAIAGRTPDPLRIPPNAATRAYDRWYETVKAGNWDAVDALYGAAYVFDDRRRLFRETHGREGGVINTRFLFEGGWRPVQTLLATAGDRLALQRIVWTTSEAGAVSEIEVLELSELDGEGRFVRVVLFDPDDRAAASAELFERYARSGADGMPPRRSKSRTR
jgi:class 3 adenylate cyclase/tetratricopeptide (TPR) repeat protein